MKKILFSLIGKTDPVSNYFDGSMLHICRYCRPDIIYLYISEEFLQYHRQDDRYRKTIELLGKQMCHDFEVHIIERPELKAVYIFDTFYDDFEKELGKIYQRHGKDIELIINLSQGTPAMKSALQVVAALAGSTIKLMQVSGPEQNSLMNYDLPADYSIMDYWEVNQDNSRKKEWESATDAERRLLQNPNRTFEVQNVSFNMQIQKEIIVKMLYSYDYTASLLVANGIKNCLPGQVLTLLEAAQNRISLKLNLCLKKLGSIECGWMVPYRNADGLIYEYALWLSIKQQRQEYLDFIRGMTPLLFALSKLCVKNKLKITIEGYCTSRYGTLYLNRNELEKSEDGKTLLDDMEQAMHRTYGDKFLSEEQLIALIQQQLGNDKVIHDFKLLYKIEKQIRNPAAHNIAAIVDADIKEITGYSSEDIMIIFKRIIRYLDFSVSDKEWNSYQHMNRKIVELLKL